MILYTFAETATEDLEQIVAYIALHDGEARAEAMYAKFIRAFELIGHSPRAGFQRLDRTAPNIRWWTVVPFYILYDCERKPPRIEHIFHAARNPDFFTPLD